MRIPNCECRIAPPSPHRGLPSPIGWERVPQAGEGVQNAKADFRIPNFAAFAIRHSNFAISAFGRGEVLPPFRIQQSPFGTRHSTARLTISKSALLSADKDLEKVPLPGGRLLTRFLDKARAHLTARGQILLGWGQGANTKQLEDLCRRFNYTPQVVISSRMREMRFDLYSLRASAYRKRI